MDYKTAFIVTYICLFLVTAKNLIVGSDFNFIYWFVFGKKYMQWHNNKHKETFKEYLNKQLDKENPNG